MLPRWLAGNRIEIRRELLRAERREDDLRERIDRLATGLKDARKNLSHLSQGVHSLLEEEHVRRFASLARPDPPQLATDHPDTIRALLELLERVGVDRRTFVDIGCGRSGGKSDALFRRFGWQGLFVDASDHAVEALRRRVDPGSGTTVIHATVTPDNVNDIVGSLGEPPDLLSIDIDSYDYWVWKALDAQPRVVIVEYNSHLGREAVAVPYEGIRPDAPKGYFGASLAAMAKMGAEKGYLLLGCDHPGVNAFFARTDLCGHSLARCAAAAWRPNLSRVDTDEVARDGAKVRSWIEKAGLPLVEV